VSCGHEARGGNEPIASHIKSGCMHQKIVMTHRRSKWGVNLTILQPEDVSLQSKGADTIETHEPRVSLSFCNLHRRWNAPHRRARDARSGTSSHWN
jgi:hypothetical protein